MQAQRPLHFPELAEVCLRALAARGLGHFLVVGGAAGLLHYLDYRPTRDLDAWWPEEISRLDQERVLVALEEALRPFGMIRRRSWGDGTTSLELVRQGRVDFSVQVERRSARLSPAESMGWIDVPLDSVADLVAAKMAALVERGAPRDFRDIHALGAAGLVSVEQCWSLWRRRLLLAGETVDGVRAGLAVETHLARIRKHRPLDGIPDSNSRREAEEVRDWFARVFLPAAPGESDPEP